MRATAQGAGEPDEATADPALHSEEGGLQPVSTVAEAAKYLRVNRKTIYAEIAAGRIRVIRLGRSVRIPREALKALCAGK
jgi:excisionase family DNA binding protein